MVIYICSPQEPSRNDRQYTVSKTVEGKREVGSGWWVGGGVKGREGGRVGRLRRQRVSY